MEHATPEVERSLLRPSALKRLIILFVSARAESFELVVSALLVMLSSSVKLREVFFNLQSWAFLGGKKN